MNKTSKNESGIQQVFDMNTNGDMSVAIKIDYLVDTIRGLKTIITLLTFICFLLLSGVVYLAVDNYKTNVYVEKIMDNMNMRHYAIVKELKKRSE